MRPSPATTRPWATIAHFARRLPRLCRLLSLRLLSRSFKLGTVLAIAIGLLSLPGLLPLGGLLSGGGSSSNGSDETRASAVLPEEPLAVAVRPAEPLAAALRAAAEPLAATPPFAAAPPLAGALRAAAERPAARLHLPPVLEEGDDLPLVGWTRRGSAPTAASLGRVVDTAAANGPTALSAATPITVPLLAIPVEFTAAETLEYQVHNDDRSRCITVTNTFTGPLHGQIPYPGGDPGGGLDNQTTYYSSTEPRDYERLIFGRVGYTVPLRAGDPNVNSGAGADISGLTVQSYFDAQSDGTVTITGTVAPWVPIAHSEAYYGLDYCIPNVSPRAIPDEQLGSLADLATSAAEKLVELGPPYDQHEYWDALDGDGDGKVDSLWIVHAGRGQEYGGGSEGEAALWSRSSSISAYGEHPSGYTIHDNDTPEVEDDIRLDRFVILPEDSDIGVLIEEFGHSAFGLPDLYTLSSSNSVGWWAPMSAGIWGGELGGTRPVNMPLWFRMIAQCGDAPCGWADPVATVPYSTTPRVIVLGEAGTPAGTEVVDGEHVGETVHEGLRINLPPQPQPILNYAGRGRGAYSGSAAGTSLSLERSLDLSHAAGVLEMSFDAYWRIPRNWGYAYVEVARDGEDFTSLPDLDNRFSDANPYGINEGYGLTGDGEGRLRFDLSDYAGDTIRVRLRYLTYQGASGTGWWIDNFRVDSRSGTVIDDTFDGGLVEWRPAGWSATPDIRYHAQHYLIEWRNSNGFDASLNGAYNTSISTADTWRVDRVPAKLPGALVMYRNLRYPVGGAFLPQLTDAPSIGSKSGLLVVDTDFWPTRRQSGRPFAGSLESLDGALSLRTRPSFELEVRDEESGELLGNDTIAASPPESLFDDAKGYYPGHVADPGETPMAVGFRCERRHPVARQQPLQHTTHDA